MFLHLRYKHEHNLYDHNSAYLFALFTSDSIETDNAECFYMRSAMHLYSMRLQVLRAYSDK